MNQNQNQQRVRSNNESSLQPIQIVLGGSNIIMSQQPPSFLIDKHIQDIYMNFQQQQYLNVIRQQQQNPYIFPNNQMPLFQNIQINPSPYNQQINQSQINGQGSQSQGQFIERNDIEGIQRVFIDRQLNNQNQNNLISQQIIGNQEQQNNQRHQEQQIQSTVQNQANSENINEVRDQRSQINNQNLNQQIVKSSNNEQNIDNINQIAHQMLSSVNKSSSIEQSISKDIQNQNLNDHSQQEKKFLEKLHNNDQDEVEEANISFSSESEVSQDKKSPRFLNKKSSSVKKDLNPKQKKTKNSSSIKNIQNSQNQYMNSKHIFIQDIVPMKLSSTYQKYSQENKIQTIMSIQNQKKLNCNQMIEKNQNYGQINSSQKVNNLNNINPLGNQQIQEVQNIQYFGSQDSNQKIQSQIPFFGKDQNQINNQKQFINNNFIDNNESLRYIKQRQLYNEENQNVSKDRKLQLNIKNEIKIDLANFCFEQNPQQLNQIYQIIQQQLSNNESNQLQNELQQFNQQNQSVKQNIKNSEQSNYQQNSNKSSSFLIESNHSVKNKIDIEQERAPKNKNMIINQLNIKLQNLKNRFEFCDVIEQLIVSNRMIDEEMIQQFYSIENAGKDKVKQQKLNQHEQILQSIKEVNSKFECSLNVSQNNFILNSLIQSCQPSSSKNLLILNKNSNIQQISDLSFISSSIQENQKEEDEQPFK